MNTIKPSVINQMLGSRIDQLCAYLLPNGKRNGKVFEVGNPEGDTGKSCKVYLDGSGWYDFAQAESGDYLSLWQYARGLGFAEVIQEAKDWLGIQEPERKKTFVKPKKPAVHKKNDAIEYLKSRGLTEKTISQFSIEQSTFHGKPSIIFPYQRKDVALSYKNLLIERPDGKKQMAFTSKDFEKTLFGWQLTPNKKLSYIVICEGEIDAMSFVQLGFPALSVPFGGGKAAKQDWIDNEYKHLSRFENIILCLDSDDAGNEGAVAIAERLGIDRCRIASLPFKDCNECLMQKVPKEVIRDCISKARFLDRDEIKSPLDVKDSVIERMTNPVEKKGIVTPWEKVNKDFLLGYSELTILNGVNGHGKSDVANQIILEAGFSGIPTMIFSMELQNDILVERLVKQSTGSQNPPVEYISHAIDELHEKVWFVDIKNHGKEKAKTIIQLMEYGYRRYGVKLFLIDSLMKCGIAEDDYNGQKDFVDRLCDFKQLTKTHVMLVTHSRKGENEEKVTGKMDIKGSGAISDLADNIMIVWRNKKWEALQKKLDENIELDLDEQQKHEKGTGLIISLVKNRNGSKEGRYGLFFRNNQFLEYFQQPIKRYVQPPMRGVA